MITGYLIHSDGYSCQNCGRTYKVFASVKRHIRHECGKLPSIPCTEPNCNYKAKHTSRMSQHILMVHSKLHRGT